jgi:hypothetical protein
VLSSHRMWSSPHWPAEHRLPRKHSIDTAPGCDWRLRFRLRCQSPIQETPKVRSTNS